MNSTKRIALIGVFTALYFVLSAMLKIPIAGHITLDLGYIALTVSAVFLGGLPAMTVGILGAFLESAVLSQKGVSLGWCLMNAVVGYACGAVLYRTSELGRKKFLVSAALVIPLSMLIGVVAKTFVDCALYDVALIAKIPSSTAAWITDSAVMLVIGIPLSMALKNRLKHV